MIDQELWEKRHRTGIGGSDAPAVLGVSPWKSRLGLWEEKVGEAPPREVSERMIWGSRLERAILEGYGEDRGVKVSYVGFRRSKDAPFVIGHPDGWAEDRVVEVKTAEMLGESWGEEGSDQVPEVYWVQVQHYLYLMDKGLADLVLLLRGNTLKTYTIPADRNFQISMIEDEERFWRDNVGLGIPPDPDGSEDSARVLGRLYPRGEGEIVATPEISKALRDLVDVKAEIKGMEGRETELTNRIKAYMGTRTRVVGDGVSASWVPTEGRIGWKEVAAAYRALIAEIGEKGLSEERMQIIEQVKTGTVEGLYRGEMGSRFTPVKKEGKV